MSDAKLLGEVGESFAAREYRKRGYTLVAANYKVRVGEIDFIAIKGEILVFVEVKSRSCTSFALPREFVDATKQSKIILAAKSFLETHKNYAEYVCRFDVAEVYFLENKDYQINIIENAFTL